MMEFMVISFFFGDPVCAFLLGKSCVFLLANSSERRFMKLPKIPSKFIENVCKFVYVYYSLLVTCVFYMKSKSLKQYLTSKYSFSFHAWELKW